jgi:catechol 2,3-dioxygenase-like lactoylglutathione lyase family enzyme
VAQKTRIHLKVVDTNRSSAFYEALLGAAPAVRSAHVAVFELDSPPLVLTLEEHPDALRARPPPPRRTRAARGSEDPGRDDRADPRFALLVNEPRELGTAAIALRRAGVPLRLEDQAIEALDPDGNAWRIRFVPSTPDRAVVAT